jgi:serine O-acetyltransferase
VTHDVPAGARVAQAASREDDLGVPGESA